MGALIHSGLMLRQISSDSFIIGFIYVGLWNWWYDFAQKLANL